MTSPRTLRAVAVGTLVGCGTASTPAHTDGGRSPAPPALVDGGAFAQDGGAADVVGELDASVAAVDAAGPRVDAGLPDAGPSIPADLCDRVEAPLGSCFTGSSCQQSSDPAGYMVISSVCVFGSTLREGLGCSTRELVGRCYRDNGGFPYWQYYYGDRASAAALEQSVCNLADERWCPFLPGLDGQDYAECQAICDERAPDFSATPECELGMDCVGDCVEAVRGLPEACADCVRQGLVYPASGCGSFECVCYPPEFPRPDPLCADAC